MSEPGTSGATDADRAEQDAPVEVSAPATAGEATPVGDDVPEGDALEQQLATRPGEAGRPVAVGDREASDADVLEQQADVPVDEDDLRG
ncbi:hypothetical protein [Blastococcus sp. URHD0036]|uniref:hypothetical protein n=1 Tax=Blastococcus sp. URHD0036 TaxID=1380356 RepID=UPI0004964A41|nr:hypothetical protein [Blastococcus sp. URHD0036]